MPQPALGPVWHDRIELLLEGGGHLPGAVEIVEIRHKAGPCNVTRKRHVAYVNGQLQVFVYYRKAISARVYGQGAEVPWHTEVPLPETLFGTPEAEVVNVEHVHQLEPAEERLRHTMHITFDIWTGQKPKEQKLLPASPLVTENTPASSPNTQVPQWAKEAVQELMQSQHPGAAETPAWLRAGNKEKNNSNRGIAEGTYTREGQAYTGPTPEWPRGISFALIEQTLEGEPYDVDQVQPTRMPKMEGAAMPMEPDHSEPEKPTEQPPPLPQSEPTAALQATPPTDQPELAQAQPAPAEQAPTEHAQAELVEVEPTRPEPAPDKPASPASSEPVLPVLAETTSPTPQEVVPEHVVPDAPTVEQKKDEPTLVWKPFPKTDLPPPR